MAVEAYAAENDDKIHSDVLTKARESCYKVSSSIQFLLFLLPCFFFFDAF
jgi:hypothetical protein